MLTIIGARDIQRNYKKVIDQVNAENKPVILVSRNKPVAAIVSIPLLKKLQKNVEAEKKPSSTKALLDLAGIVKEGLPSDLSEKIDEYIWDK